MSMLAGLGAVWFLEGVVIVSLAGKRTRARGLLPNSLIDC